MFYFDDVYGKKVLKSNLLNVEHFFTTRSCIDFSKINCNRILRPEQTHSDNVQIVNESNDYPDTDGLIIWEKGDVLCLKFADCTPLIIYDKKNNIGAISHAGWRGTAQSIGIKTVQKMKDNFNSKMENIIVVIGPAIGLCCYEVSKDVKGKLLSTVKKQEGLFKGNNVDLKRINAQQFIEYGITNIDICPYCTSCNNDLFYSYRKENGTTSRHYAVLKL